MKRDSLQGGLDHGTQGALIEPNRILLPVVHVPNIGNVELRLSRAEPGTGAWQIFHLKLLEDALWPTAEFDNSLGSIRFVDPDGGLHSMQAILVAPPFDFRFSTE